MNKVVSLLFWLFVCALPYCKAQTNAIVNDYSINVNCSSLTQADVQIKKTITILNKKGEKHAVFSCTCSRNNKLSSFKGTVTDANGKVLKRMKQNDLQRSEYSPYLAIDDYLLIFDYDPPTYPVTINYEWSMECRDNLIEFPAFCPIVDYDVEVEKASYRLYAPKEVKIRYAMQNINAAIEEMNNDNGQTGYQLQIENQKPLPHEPYARPLRERIPIAYFAPTLFKYFGTTGSLANWQEYGLWVYELGKDRQQLPEEVKAALHRECDGLANQRAKIQKVYERLGNTTRYVAVLLGIGGMQPAQASDVAKRGYGDCKGLTNYMRAMLEEVGIPSFFTTISTENTRLLTNFASVGQMNHAILQVPDGQDTLWIECTNPQIPLGYVHHGIAGHDAIVISEYGGKLCKLPRHPDEDNLLNSNIKIRLDANGGADITFTQEAFALQYENRRPLLTMDSKKRLQVLSSILHAPQANARNINIEEVRNGNRSSIKIDVQANSQKYANITAQRMFIPLCPIHGNYNAPRIDSNRSEDLFFETGHVDEDQIEIEIPDGYVIESRPKDLILDKVYGIFTCKTPVEGSKLTVTNRLLQKSGHFNKELLKDYIDFRKNVSSAYGQNLIIRKATNTINS